MDRTRPDQGGALATTASSRLTRPRGFLRSVGRLRACPPARERFRVPWATSQSEVPVAESLSPVHLGGERASELRRQRIQGWRGFFFAGSAALMETPNDSDLVSELERGSAHL